MGDIADSGPSSVELDTLLEGCSETFKRVYKEFFLLKESSSKIKHSVLLTNLLENVSEISKILDEQNSGLSEEERIVLQKAVFGAYRRIYDTLVSDCGFDIYAFAKGLNESQLRALNCLDSQLARPHFSVQARVSVKARVSVQDRVYSTFLGLLDAFVDTDTSDMEKYQDAVERITQHFFDEVLASAEDVDTIIADINDATPDFTLLSIRISLMKTLDRVYAQFNSYMQTSEEIVNKNGSNYGPTSISFALLGSACYELASIILERIEYIENKTSMGNGNRLDISGRYPNFTEFARATSEGASYVHDRHLQQAPAEDAKDVETASVTSGSSGESTSSKSSDDSSVSTATPDDYHQLLERQREEANRLRSSQERRQARITWTKAAGDVGWKMVTSSSDSAEVVTGGHGPATPLRAVTA